MPWRWPAELIATSRKAGPTTRSFPAPPINDSAFLRRVSLHLAGRIPSVYEVRRFLDDTRRRQARPRGRETPGGAAYPMHMANVWHSWLLPEAEARQRVGGFGPPLEAWLRARPGGGRRLRQDGARTGDGLAPSAARVQHPAISSPRTRSMTAPPRSPSTRPSSSRRRTWPRPPRGCCWACTRLHQCHNHPFADWKREQFWEFAAFFAGVSQNGLDTAAA